MAADQIRASFSKYTEVKAPDIPVRKLPKVEKNPGRFGAYYTKLKYYPGWDNLWPVDQDPDIVVCFEKSPVKLIFWRGIRYGASWVSENENWMTDQSVETWENGEKDPEGCFEHMQDRHCRFSHVRIIENSDARIVIHWRYAPVSAYNNTWMPDPRQAGRHGLMSITISIPMVQPSEKFPGIKAPWVIVCSFRNHCPCFIRDK